MSGDEPQDNLYPEPQHPPSGRPLTSPQKALITQLAEHLVEEYLAEETDHETQGHQRSTT
jgi:hypothetical protein